MIYGIPSFKRPEVKTVNCLREAGVRKEDIIISCQTEEDYKAYKSAHECEVIFREADCAAGNRNNLLDYIGGECVLLDDDITSFSTWFGDRFLKNNIGFIDAIPRMFEICRNNKTSIFGISPTDSNIIALNRPEVDWNFLLQGTVIGVVDYNIRFNEKYKMVEDYELALRQIRKGGGTARFNRFSMNKPKNGTNDGGLHERYARGELSAWIALLSRQYPEFKPNNKMTGGQIIRGR